MSDWIFIKDRLPDKDSMVLVYASCVDESAFIGVAHYNPNGFGWSLIPKVWIVGIEAWMPLPKPPRAKLLKKKGKICL